MCEWRECRGSHWLVDVLVYEEAGEAAVSLHFFFFNDTATTEIYTLSLHDALPISRSTTSTTCCAPGCAFCSSSRRSEEHTSELQSPCNLVCRLLLEKKKRAITRMVRLKIYNIVVTFTHRQIPHAIKHTTSRTLRSG